MFEDRDHAPPPALAARPADFRWQLAHEEQAGIFSIDEIVQRRVGTGVYRGIDFLEVHARSIINAVPKTSKMPFRYTINAYRGCTHACTYCFARPTHSYLNLDIGQDFETKIVVKVNAVERLRAELRGPRWRHEAIAMGTNTDPYQPAEGKYHLTRGIVEVLAETGNPFSILTKSTLILRDLDLLRGAAQHTNVQVAVSIGTIDREVWRLSEPGTPPPDKRLEVVRRFAEAGIGCSVLMAPVLPGISDAEELVRATARACIDAGTRSITPIALHLRPGVREHYLSWLQTQRPELVPLYESRFARGAYQGAEEQGRLGRVVASELARTRKPDQSPAASQNMPRPRTSKGVGGAKGVQLELL